MTSRERRDLRRRLQRAVGADLGAIGVGADKLSDADLVRLWCAVKRGDVEAIAAFDAARRLCPRDRFADFRYWYKPRGEGQTIRMIGEPFSYRHHYVKGPDDGKGTKG